MRTPWLTDVANGINVAGSSWGATVLGLSVVALTMAFRRWRHLLVFVGSLFFLEFVGTSIYFGLSRPRPYGVPIIGSWAGYSGVSPPVAVLTIFLMGAIYCLAVPGRPRTLAPKMPPIVLQRWSIRRVALAAAMLAIITAAVFKVGDAFLPGAQDLGSRAPTCGTGHSMILSAQAVPSAALLPCVAALPSGWQVRGADISSGKARLWLDSDRAGPQAVTVTLTAHCDTSGARQIPSDQPGTRRFERPLSLAPGFSDLRFYTFPGGCVTYQFRFGPGAPPVLAVAVDSALAFQPRSSLVRYVWRTENLVLCGRGAACPGRVP
jgi:hypothetical protein